MTAKKQLITAFISLLEDKDKSIYQQIIEYLAELGYFPERQKAQGCVLSFKHSENNKVIAKIGIRNSKNQEPFVSLKFFACKSVPPKYTDALRHEIDSHNMQYCCSLWSISCFNSKFNIKRYKRDENSHFGTTQLLSVNCL